ncbi:PilZ domain-containing protein [Desulfovibrio litoralis]|uniref:PilZ domain-containing protein n=1 Tax=Desulfovibrio litoralis DSM 11393 TaxID=1121455 RepID=A0A1M7SF84_9BACT|nr:PilZ domain-containing protein [Desulfovibrio litoralis]SHN57158.1 PilZ domain-containing protein [Desulfovibrio litoralis DSM 11393]
MTRLVSGSFSQGNTINNSRKHKRLPKPFPVMLCPLTFSPSSFNHDAYCIDISKGGLSLETRRAYTIGDKLQVKIHMPRLNKYSPGFFKYYENDADQYFTAISEVAWCKSQAGSYCVGIKFINVDEDQSIALGGLINNALSQFSASL